MTPSGVPVAVDVGNSHIKVGIQKGGSIAKVVRFEHGFLGFIELVEKETIDLTGERPKNWILAGVVPGEVARLKDALEHHGVEVCWLNQQSQVGLQLSLDEPEKVGLDRLLAAKAAYHRSKGKACMVVDVGTALTVNWVDRAGVFMGGSIQPGWKLMAKSLGEGTAALPEIATPGPLGVQWPAKNTKEAIEAGLLNAMLGSIERSWRRARQMDHEATLWFTGGCGALIAKLFENGSFFQPNLVLEGMFLSACLK